MNRVRILVILDFSLKCGSQNVDEYYLYSMFLKLLLGRTKNIHRNSIDHLRFYT